MKTTARAAEQAPLYKATALGPGVRRDDGFEDKGKIKMGSQLALG